MKELITYILILAIVALNGCKARDDYAIKTLRTNKEVADAALNPNGIDSREALTVISETSNIAANKLDPQNKIEPVTTAQNIVYADKYKPEDAPNPEIEKIYKYVNAGPGWGSFGWASILGFGAMAVGLVGKFLGPPFNIVGSLVQGVAARTLPNYDRDRKAAMGTLVAVDQTLDQYGTLLDAVPDTKAKLAEKLGMDPVVWMKDKLNKAHQDLGVHSEVDALMTVLKTQLTTEDGILTPEAEELDKLLAKKI